MSIMTLSRGDPREKFTPFTRNFFESPQPAGRKITAGFTYIQRISKAASYDVWFPEKLKQRMQAKISAGLGSSDSDFPAEWAAVRQFELLHEAGNYKIYDLDSGDIKRSMRDLSRSMRAGGYRVTVATIGKYRETGVSDELEILDHRLQKRIAQMIHMLYLDDASADVNAQMDTALTKQKWDYREALPHVGMVLGAQNLFWPADKGEEEDTDPKRKKGKKDSGDAWRLHRQAKQFFDILSLLPQKHIVHDTAIGLQLPELNGENEWNYIASPDETLAAFSHSLCSLFDCFNGLSLSRLHERADATSECKSSVFHMRSYGHPLSDNDLKFYRESALALG